MSLPRYVTLRGDTYYVRRPIPLDLQPAFAGRKEIVRTLGTTSLKAAGAKSHAVLADIEREFEKRRRDQEADHRERAFVESDDFDAALQQHSAITRGTLGSVTYARRAASPDDDAAVKLAVLSGAAVPRPTSRAAVLKAFEETLSEVEFEATQVRVLPAMDEDHGASIVNVPSRYASAVEEFLASRLEADKRTLEAKRAAIAGVERDAAAATSAVKPISSLNQLLAVWASQRRPTARSQEEMRTAIRRFEGLVGPLAYADITAEHARRFRNDLLTADGLKSATKEKLWNLLRALLNVAFDEGLLRGGSPFTGIKLKLNDDSDPREVLTKDDLQAVFSKLPPEEWWIARISLYSGARLGEICQLTKGDLVTIGGVAFFNIRPDAEAGKSVKTRSSIRKVPVHQQLIADGLLEWVMDRPGDSLFSIASAPASKRLNRRMRDAGLGDGKVFHSFRHTFKGVARRHMATEWHDRLTGHAAKSVGQTYGDYDLRTLKEKIDLIGFGIETP